ncbi:transposase [Alteromonas halophila]|uniref:transposase n=1 Tax=Alteromonas halophila TaxID=516698 RepID=UPI00357176B5
MTEDFYNKMEVLLSRAYGFRNFANYRIRVITHWICRLRNGIVLLIVYVEC